MSRISTHLLDTVRGEPAAGIAVRLETADGQLAATGVTDFRGRIDALGDALVAGRYSLTFATGVATPSGSPLFESLTVELKIDGEADYHIPLLLSPNGLTLYRGARG